jgi:hypothetical protein
MEKSMLPYGEPTKLYTIDDLRQGYDRDDPMAFAKSWDFRTYGTYFADGSATPKTLDIRLAQAGCLACMPTNWQSKHFRNCFLESSCCQGS